MQALHPLTVVLVDDQRAYRDGLARAIARHNRLELVAVAARGDEALEVIEALQPDVALIDVRLTGISGTDVCGLLRERHPDLETRLVMMSVEGPAPYHELHPLVEGFVSKERSRREICEMLVQVGQRAQRRVRLPA